mgnify:CR=1 FL=1
MSGLTPAERAEIEQELQRRNHSSDAYNSHVPRLLAHIEALEAALAKINRWASPRPERTLDGMMNNLTLIADEARAALQRLKEGNE